MFFFSLFLFFFFFLFLTHHTKLSRFSNHTVQKVLQSANIMNWHKLVYTFHFSGWQNKENKQRAHFFIFVRSGSQAHRLLTHFPLTTSNDILLNHMIKGVSSTFSSPKVSRFVKRKRKKIWVKSKSENPKERRSSGFSNSCTTCTTSHIWIEFYCIAFSDLLVIKIILLASVYSTHTHTQTRRTHT